ncbi:MAG: hypothetical protein KDA74_16810 [Planctomycetaceae bacterium]|nr:hypothetical protein [Planctomycetaceae bacterium]
MQEENQTDDDQFAALRSTESNVSSLDGIWRAKRPNGEIELSLNKGEFQWAYDLKDSDESFDGKYEITGDMMLLATEQGSQMVGKVTHHDQDHFTFRLLGANESDPGVNFQRR